MGIWQVIITSIASVLVTAIPALIAAKYQFEGIKKQLEANSQKSTIEKQESKQEILDMLKEQNKNEDESLKCLIRTDILRIYFRHYKEEHPCMEQWEKENLVELYKQYRQLGGNSFITEVYDIMKTWKMTRVE